MSYIGNEPIVSATRTITEITATAGQTVFVANGGYTVGYIDVFVNGAQLQTSDFTATNGSSITLTEAAQSGDVIRLVAWGTFATSTHVLKAGDTMSGGLNVLGNLGVGTSSPAVSIDARKSGDVQIRAFETGLSVDTRVVSVGGAGQAGIIGTYSNHPLVTYTNGVERQRIDTSGRVTTPNQPAFSVGKSNGGTGDASVGNTGSVVYNNSLLNIGGHYNTSNGRFTAPIAGTYLLMAHHLTASASYANAILFLNINGLTIVEGYAYVESAYTTCHVFAVVYMNAGDYAHIGQANASWYNAANTHARFSGHLIG